MNSSGVCSLATALEGEWYFRQSYQALCLSKLKRNAVLDQDAITLTTVNTLDELIIHFLGPFAPNGPICVTTQLVLLHIII